MKNFYFILFYFFYISKSFAFCFEKFDIIEIKKKECKTCKEHEQGPTKIGIGKKNEVKKSFFVVAISNPSFAENSRGKVIGVPLVKKKNKKQFSKFFTTKMSPSFNSE